MATIKAFTSQEQSEKLAKILPLESADMYYPYFGDNKWGETPRYGEALEYSSKKDIHCWSLASLLNVLPHQIINHNQMYIFSMHQGFNRYGETYVIRYNIDNTDICIGSTEYYNNPVDACYEMILQLKEKGLL